MRFNKEKFQRDFFQERKIKEIAKGHTIGMTEIAEETGVNTRSLYNTCLGAKNSDNPSFLNIMAVCTWMGTDPRDYFQIDQE